MLDGRQGTAAECGLLPRTLDVLFNSISTQQYQGAPVCPKFYSDVAFLEPAEQQLCDRIKDESLTSKVPKARRRTCMCVRHGAQDAMSKMDQSVAADRTGARVWRSAGQT